MSDPRDIPTNAPNQAQWVLPSNSWDGYEDGYDTPAQPAFDSHTSEFAQRLGQAARVEPPSSSNERDHAQQDQHFTTKAPIVDLRALEYTTTYDPHLMCPICHVPFIDPVVVSCDHTFCKSCFDELRYDISTGDRKCPSCRGEILKKPRKASRLIHNMCNDIKVQCPNKGCGEVMPRGYVETHVSKGCPEQQLACPTSDCDQMTRRKNYTPEHCEHKFQVKCSCGKMVGIGEMWEKHQDEECPHTRMNCQDCDEEMSSSEHRAGNHVCGTESRNKVCPGMEYGCTDEILPNDLNSHIAACSLARIAPYLKAQSRLLESVQEQLASSKLHNANLEAELDRMKCHIHEKIDPKLESLIETARESNTLHEDHFHDHDNDIEEIPRENNPAAIHHRDLLLPAHIRDLTPSPDVFAVPHDHSLTQRYLYDQQRQLNDHLLSNHEDLRHTVTDIAADVQGIHEAMRELDGRTNMHLINEVLGIKEQLAFTNASLVSHRNQVQYLLNRERIGREQAILRDRGRVGGQAQQSQGQSTSDADRQALNTTTPGASTQPQQIPSDGFPFPAPGASMTRSTSGNGAASGPSSAATSPVFTGIGLNGSRRPSMRGGSQERVKL